MANFYPTTTQELIDAINSANNNGQQNTIHLNGGVYEFDTFAYAHPTVSTSKYALPVVTSNLTIRGNNSIFQRSVSAPDFGYIHVDGTVKFKLEEITFEEGKAASGGALLIYDADAEINNCNFLSNSVIAYGGAIAMAGPPAILRLSNCVFNANSAVKGGALSISSMTSATINKCTFESNNAAALYVYYADVIVQYSKFNNNTPYQGTVVLDETPSSINQPVNAQYNDWGDPSGPSGAGSGSGDAISSNIIYMPFIGVTNPPKHKGVTGYGKDCSVVYASKGSKATGNPISLDEGEKRLEETDIQLITPLGALAFTRRYRQSQQDTLDFMGLGWTHDHIYSLVENGGTPNEIVVTMGGSTLIFEDDNADDIFEAAAGSASVIVKTGSDYDLTASDESVYHFDNTLKLITHTLSNGEVWTYSYDGSGNLTQVSDGYGRSLEFAYYTGTSSFKEGLLWRVGALGVNQTSDLTNTTPTMPYVELDYTDDGNGDALLTDVQDVRGEDWTYRYYGSEAGETDTKWTNFLVERFSPAVDRDGDGSADSAITLEALTYDGTARDAISQIVQNRGESLMTKTLDFDPANDVTTETVEGLDLTHNFTNGVYLGTEDDQNNAQEQAPLSNYRPAYQQDAKGNRTAMKWSADGKRLEGVVDAEYNETSFSYDSQDRLISSTDAEGHITEYAYGDSNVPRQPTVIEVFDTDGTTLLRQQEFVYDPKGRTTSEKLIDPTDGTTVLQETTRAYGTGGNENGLLESISVIDSLNTNNNSTTQYTYDAQGRVIRTQKISMFGTCEYNHTVYDEAGNVLGTACGLVTATPIPADKTALLALYNASDSLKKYTRITTHDYDEMGRRVATTSNAGTSWARINRTIYDALGRVIRSIQNYDEQDSSAPGAWVWDETAEEWQYSSTISTAVSHGAELDQNIISDMQYNGRGLVNMRRDVIGRVTLYGYNNADRLVKTVQNASKIPLDPNATTSYDYDMRYGGSGDPDLSEYELVASSLSDEDIITEQVYDPNGNVIKAIDARGGISYTIYDALNRPIKVISNANRDLSEATILADLDFANYGPYSTEPDQDMISTTEYDALGRVLQSKRLMENRGASEEWDATYYVYDSLGRQIRTIQHYVEPASGLTPENWVFESNTWKDQPTGTLIDFGDNDQNLITQTRYDMQGRVQETEDVNERVTRMVYDGFNRQVMSIANYVAQANPPEDWEWANNRWEDGSGNAISHGTANDQNIISKTVYDDDGHVESTRNVQGLVSRNAYDDAGRSILRVQNYVEQGDPKNWEWTNNQWEDGSSTAIARGTNFDQNLISKPDYDDEQRVVQTRDARGNLSRQVFDESGRTVMSITNYVAQANPPEDWEWANNRWEDGSGNAIDHGTNNDQNRISSTEYDLLGRAFRTRDVAGRETYTVYDAVGRVLRRVQNYVQQGSSLPDDWSWSEINAYYEYSAGNAVDTGTANDQNIISETVYNQAGQVISTRDAFGTQSSFSYDAAGRRVLVTQASNTGLASSSYTCFDKAGRVLRSIANYLALYDEQAQVISPDEWDANENWLFNPGEHGTYRDRNIISEMVYDRASRRVSSINPEGDLSQTTYFKDGQVDSMTDPEGMVTVYRYDALRRRTLVVQSYVANGEDPEGWVWNGSQYTKSDATTAIAHGTEDDENIIVMVSHDIADRMDSMRDPRGNLTEYAYDKLGRRTSLTNPLGKEWETSYAEVNGAQQTTMTYPGVNGGSSYPVVRDFDRFGRLLSIDYDNDSNTPLVNFAYDVLGNRLSMTENNGTSDIRITDYLYDQTNRLTQVDFDTDGDSVVEESVSYDYDIRGLRTQLTMPGNLSISYNYDAKGRLISLDDWDSQESQFNYDALNRHIGTIRPNGMRSVYKMDGAGRLRELRHENKKRETLAAFRYTVDGRGNQVQAQELTLAPSATLTTQTVQHTDSEKVLYTGTWTDTSSFHESTQWDARMALIFVGEQDVELTIGEGPDHSIFDLYVDGTLYESVDAYAASAGSRVVNIALKGDGWHGLEIRNRHAKNMQSSGYKVRFASLSVDTALAETVIDYSYDSLSRLIEADYNNGSSVLNYGYDVAGNLVNYDGVTRTYNEANQMTNDGTNSLTYDNNGNLTDDGIAYTWDRANRLKVHNGHTYTYDGLGNRVQEIVADGLPKIYDYLNDVAGGLTKLLAETHNSDVTRYVHAPRGIHAIEQVSGDWLYYVQDGLGSVRGAIDEAGAVYRNSSFTPYGELADGTLAGTTGSVFGFTGEQTNASGQVFLRARYYEPQLGIFSALDPWEGISNRPMSLNGYSWVEGNVVNATDPSGKQSLTSSDCEGRLGGMPYDAQARCNYSRLLARHYPESGGIDYWLRFSADSLRTLFQNRASEMSYAIVPLDFMPITGNNAQPLDRQQGSINTLRRAEEDLDRPLTFEDIISIILRDEFSAVLSDGVTLPTSCCGASSNDFKRLILEALTRNFGGQCRRDGRYGEEPRNSGLRGECGAGRLINDFLSQIEAWYNTDQTLSPSTTWMETARTVVSTARQVSAGAGCYQPGQANSRNSPYTWGNAGTARANIVGTPVIGEANVLDYIEYQVNEFPYFVVQYAALCGTNTGCNGVPGNTRCSEQASKSVTDILVARAIPSHTRISKLVGC